MLDLVGLTDAADRRVGGFSLGGTWRGSALYVSDGCGLRPPVSSMVLEGMR